MVDFKMMRELHHQSNTKIVLLVLDGVGGLPIEPGGPTELEAAHTPNLDRLAAEGMLGLINPIRPGITPGSGPGHLALFGYDPNKYDVGRGVLEASGIGMEVAIGDVAARGNFCTLDAKGMIIDRRAGRLSSDQAIPLVELLSEIQLFGVEIETRHVRDYRFAVVMRGEGLAPDIDDTDPQQTGVPPHPARAINDDAKKTAGFFNAWISQAQSKIADNPKANAVTLRGFSTDPNLPQFPEIYGTRAVCVAVYPMYRGVSRLVGMQVHDFEGDRPEDEFRASAGIWDNFDFFFIHIKKIDSMGEDGNFEGKVKVIETLDVALPTLLDLNPDVVCVTGDHSTPARLRTHSWHPVPTLLWAPATALADNQIAYGERACAQGSLGIFPATDLMPLMMAHANRLAKYGA